MMWRKARKGIVGIEAAIVLIAFVIVAAALAFVTLNMGFFTTQKSGAVIQSGLGEASTALEVDGSLLAYSEKGSYVNYTIIPIKVSPGKHYVDLDPKRASILYWSMDAGSFADIYVVYGYIDVANNGTYYLYAKHKNDTILYNGTAGPNARIGSSINITEIWRLLNNKMNDDVYAAIIWIDYMDAFDTNLQIGEKAIVITVFEDTNIQPSVYETIKFEIKPPMGAPLTVEKTMPAGIDQGVIDLG